MNRFFRRISAALCAGVMLLTVQLPAVHAEEEDIMLPSGKTVKWFQTQMELTAQEHQPDNPFFASAAVGLFQGDEVLYTGYYGEADIENNIPADENTVYEWGSITKTLIWVSAMQLYEQGQLDLTRDVREYLPEGFFQHLSYDEPITMLNLMNHNAGWQETTRPIWKTDESAILPLKEELQAIEPAQVNRPGEVTAYSNYGAAVAGYVVECIAGQDYCDYVHEHIFEPLGMEHTALNPTHSDNAWVYEQRRKSKSYSISMLAGSTIDNGTALYYIPCYPAGAAAGTLTDLMTYAQALVNDDAPLFDSPETQALLFTGTDFYGESDIPICTHGFWCTEYAVRAYGHNGATLFGQADMEFDLESKTGIVVMVNEGGGNWYMNYAPTMALGDLSPDKYANETYESRSLDGYYLQARSVHSGMLKYISYMSALPGSMFAKSEDLGKGVCQTRSESALNPKEEKAMLFGEKVTPDDTLTALQSPSCDLIPDPLYPVKLSLFTLYVLSAVAAVYRLLIRRKLRKRGRWTPYAGAAAVTAGRFARVISVLILLGTYVCYAQYSGGIPFAAGAVMGVMQLLCIGVCAASAVSTCAALPKSRADRALTARHILNTVFCILPILAILYFEMYRFWGC